MAAGRHGGYLDNEFRLREINLKCIHMEDFYYKGKEYDDRRGDRRHEKRSSKGSQDASENYRVTRKREVIERVVVNGGNGLSSITSKSGINGGDNKRGGLCDRRVDQESCELPSGIVSADVNAPDSHVEDNQVQSPACKKRKVSPNMSDREVKARHSLKNKGFASSPKNPLLSKRNCQGAQISSPSSPNIFHESQLSVSKPTVRPCEPDVPASETGLYPLSPQEKLRSSGHEFGLEEEVDIVPRNVLASRWADANHSPGDKDLVSDDGDMPRRRSWNTGSQSLEASPELGEFTRNGLEGLQMKSSEYVETEGLVESFGNGGCPINISVSNNFVEIKRDGSYHSDTDSEERNCSPRAVGQVVVPQRSIDMLQGCRSVHEFERLNKIAEGTYGIVHRARDKKTGDVVALKKVKMARENEGFPLTSLREINILLSSNHPSIVDVKEVVMDDDLDNVFMVMEYMEHDLKGLIETTEQPFSQSEVKCLMLQLLEGVEYLHDNWIIHRDLKTSNILLNNRGELKICDFGLSRQYGSPLKPYTQLVVTLWYRAPELLLGAKQYSTAIDMWSLGCIMAELLARKPLFSGNSELDQIEKIFQTLGTPSEANWPGFSALPGAKAKFNRHRDNLRKKFPPASFTGSPVLSEAGFDLLKKLLTYNPTERITAHDAVNHEWFREFPLPKSKEIMPTFPAQHAQNRRLRRTMKSPDPLEEQRRRELQQGESGTGGLFG